MPLSLPRSIVGTKALVVSSLVIPVQPELISIVCRNASPLHSLGLLIKQFSASYDAPSLNVAADALIMGNKADGILLVVRPGSLNSGTVAFAKELLKKFSQHVFGLVVNGVSAKNEPHSHYYFTNESYAQEQTSNVNRKIL